MQNTQVEYSSFESKISDRIKSAEDKLELAGYTVIRHVRGMPANEVFGLEVYGFCLYDLEQVRAILGSGYKLVLNIQMQSILIR